MSNELIIGWGEADITPDGRTVDLCGQYYPRIARGIHSRIKAVTMLLEQNDKRSLMITLDTATVEEIFCTNMLKAISEKFPGIFDLNRISFNAIHTHSAPGLSGMKVDWYEFDKDAITLKEYEEFVIEKVLDSIREALDSRTVSGISSSYGIASVGHCRRPVYSNSKAEMYGSTRRDDFTGMEGNEDSSFDFLFTFDKSGNPTGAVVNVPCPSQVMEATYKISSDYMGKLRELLKRKFGPGFNTHCQIGAAGCQAPRDMTRPETIAPLWQEEGVDIIADRLFTAMDKEYESLAGNIKYDVKFDHYMEEFTLPFRRVSDSEYERAVKEMERLEKIQPTKEAFQAFCEETYANEKIPGRPGPYDTKLHHFVLIRNEEAVINRYKEQFECPDYKFPIHMLRLGDIVFATNPFEIYLEFGQCIRARSRMKQTFIVQLSNGWGGYLPTERAEKLGGYGALIINGKVDSAAGRNFVDKTVELINKNA